MARSSRSSAPIFPIPLRDIVAVEHPMIIKNIDNGMKTFGHGHPFQRIIDSHDHDGALPLYLRPNDRTCAPLLSNNAATNAVLLKITVPRRTGRKRKRGSQDPYIADGSVSPTPDFNENFISRSTEMDVVASQCRRDDPRRILQTLKDNANNHTIEAVAEINNTHRYRVDKLKKFKFDPSRGVTLCDEIVPPPSFTDHTVPFNWAYHQNPNLSRVMDEATGQHTLANLSKPPKVETVYLHAAAEEIPLVRPFEPISDDPILHELIRRLNMALEERPIWTRRAIMNHIDYRPGEYLSKNAFQFVGYQFRGGPFRDAIIKFGIDPRTDPKYRIYQTLFFQMFTSDIDKKPGQPWRDNRIEWANRKALEPYDRKSHVFDGKSLSLDGKIWQICDITDPLLQQLASTPNIRDVCDIKSTGAGWFLNGTWSKIKAIMKVKLLAIRLSKSISDDMFSHALAIPDHVEKKEGERVFVLIPDIRLTEEEAAQVRAQGNAGLINAEGLPIKKNKKKERRARILSMRPERTGRGKRRRKGGEVPASITFADGTPSRHSEIAVAGETSKNNGLSEINKSKDSSKINAAIQGNEDISDDEADMDENALDSDKYQDSEYDSEDEGFDEDFDAYGGLYGDGEEDGAAGADFYHRRYESLKASYPGTEGT
ncbi:RNA polymerase III transcription factor [Phlyctema vagabunda]|uniref:RNA polymerase III transcription factor n=1 Tax=Phlyctema vagabunda TaxID=108571 RepID=A0ABR4PI18_9HELO